MLFYSLSPNVLTVLTNGAMLPLWTQIMENVTIGMRGNQMYAFQNLELMSPEPRVYELQQVNLKHL